MANFERRLRKLEANLTDGSGLVPHSLEWLQYWDRKIYAFMKDPEHRWPKQLFPLDAFEAALQWAGDPKSLIGTISVEDQEAGDGEDNLPPTGATRSGASREVCRSSVSFANAKDCSTAY